MQTVVKAIRTTPQAWADADKAAQRLGLTRNAYLSWLVQEVGPRLSTLPPAASVRRSSRREDAAKVAA